MAKRKHFDAIGWGTATLIAVGDVLSNALTGWAAINMTDTDHVMTAAMWKGLLLVMAFATFKTIVACMKNFGQFVTEEEIVTQTTTAPSGLKIVTEQTTTTTTPTDGQ